ncbi:RNA pseudouridylate synthase domain-containing protein 2-like protein [Sarcoptes scabiei]|uniref:Pseudouridine synthase n=1 Tax=Sarcoptes scabiei TaxID=52283 RepID=A0A132AL77_SARSC|nr:RNA pseudouridylate synthase domain-containing protein 2-like protein [Sarcoptes scabiei]
MENSDQKKSREVFLDNESDNYGIGYDDRMRANKKRSREPPHLLKIKESVPKLNKRLKTEIHTSMENLINQTDYYIENRLRKVYPYAFTYCAYVKRRWVGKTVSKLFSKEFSAQTVETINDRISKGYLKVNGETIDGDYILRDNDLISHRIHRHEFPVLAAPIPIIYCDDNILVIDKPPSIPVHPCGKFRLNTILSLLERENNLDNLHVIHRLDRLTSGVMIFGRSRDHAQRFHEQIRERKVQKEYVCRVEGFFPDGLIECDQPIETLEHRIRVCLISSEGKPSRTIFQRLNFNGKSSTVLCQPITGRMHQIRVHLQYLGHPILNDKFYNNTIFGKQKGKFGEFGRSRDEILNDLERSHMRSNYYFKNGDQTSDEIDPNRDAKNEIAMKALLHYTSYRDWNNLHDKYRFHSEKILHEDDCDECRNKSIDPDIHEQLIYLHAFRYKGENWSFETQLPIWAHETWTYD